MFFAACTYSSYEHGRYSYRKSYVLTSSVTTMSDPFASWTVLVTRSIFFCRRMGHCLSAEYKRYRSGPSFHLSPANVFLNVKARSLALSLVQYVICHPLPRSRRKNSRDLSLVAELLFRHFSSSSFSVSFSSSCAPCISR